MPRIHPRKMPVLLILGQYDFAITYPVWEELITDMDHITYRLLDESSHNPTA